MFSIFGFTFCLGREGGSIISKSKSERGAGWSIDRTDVSGGRKRGSNISLRLGSMKIEVFQSLANGNHHPLLQNQ